MRASAAKRATARSVAARYDVGVHALWKRREAEGWKRPEPTLAPIEPAELQLLLVQALHDEGPALRVVQSGETVIEPAGEAPEIVLKTRRAELAGRTRNQVAYLRNILGHDITFGEMDPDAKDQISHRARAFAKLKAALL